MTGLQHTLSCALRGQKDDLNAHWKEMTHKNSRTFQIFHTTWPKGELISNENFQLQASHIVLLT